MIPERIKQVKKHFCDSNKEFASEIGETEATISGWISGKRGIGLNVLKKIFSKFPEVNIEWLITGEGKMLKQDNMTQGGHHSVQSGRDNILSVNPNASVRTINYHGLSQEEMIGMLEERYQHFVQKERQVEQIFEENRVLTNECRKLNSEKEKLIERINFLTDKLLSKNE